MATLQELTYAIEANTQGLSTAFPALDKLQKSLASLSKSVAALNKNFINQMNSVSQSTTQTAGNVQKSTDKIIEQLKRQKAMLINSTQSLITLNKQLGSTGVSTKQIDANNQALKELDKILKDGTISSADATLARAEYNAILKESSRTLSDVKKAQADALAAQKATDAALLKQANSVESVGRQYDKLMESLKGMGAAPTHMNTAAKAFNDFDNAMKSGQLTAEQFSQASNKVQNAFEGIKRQAGFEKKLVDGLKRTDESLKKQAASLTSATAKFNKFQKDIAAAGGPPALITATTKALQDLENVLNSSTTSSGDAAKARADFNAVMTDSSKQLQDYVSAQNDADRANKQTEASLLRQKTKLSDVTIQYKNMLAQLEQAGGGSKAIDDLNQAFDDFQNTMNSGALDAADFQDAISKVKTAFADIKRSSSGAFTSGLSGNLKEIVQAAQFALGPLSGIASRISSLSSLAKSGGLALAGLTAGVIAVGYALVKSVTAGIKFEQQMAQINAVLKATGNIALETGADVEKIVEDVGQATAASTDDIREAAAGLLTIDGMNKDLLKSSLMAAQGLALVGGGSIQSSYRNLAQAIQEPAQAFQTLTQYGVKFDAMEERVITRLVAQGKQAEAVAKIMDKLKGVTASATGQAESFAGQWQHALNDLQDALAQFAVESGILESLTNLIRELAKVIKASGENMKDFAKWWKQWGVAVPIIKETSKAVDDVGVKANSAEDKVRGLSTHMEWLHGLLTADIQKNSVAEWVLVAIGAMEKETEATKEAQKALDDMNAAEEVHIKAMQAGAQKVTESLKAEEVEVKRVKAAYATWQEEYLQIIRVQEDTRDQLQNLGDSWKTLETILKDQGKTEAEITAIHDRLTRAIVLQGNSYEAFIDSQKRSVILAEQDAKMAASQGAAKHDLAIQQQILNDLWSSGAIDSADIGKSLQELEVLYPGLTKRIEEQTKALEKWQFTAANNDAISKLKDDLDQSQVAFDHARDSVLGTAIAMAKAAKIAEMLNNKLDPIRDKAVWDEQLRLVEKIASTNWGTDMVKKQKDLEDQVKLANAAISASTLSVIDEAKAIAVAAKMQEMLNDGVREGSDYWKQQIALVNQLVDADFTKQSNEELKSMQQQMAVQDHIAATLFQSERTRSRAVDLANKEYELAQKYGSLTDARAQKELEMFKNLQERDKLLQHFQDLSDALDGVFSKAEDAIVEFAQTGQIEIDKLIRGIAEDFFRVELRYLILDPLHDMLGKGLGALTGQKGLPGLLGGKGGADMLFKAPLPVTIVSGMEDLVGENGAIKKALGDTAKKVGGGATCGCIGDSLKDVTKKVSDAVTGDSSATDVLKKVHDSIRQVETGGGGGSSVVKDAVEKTTGSVQDTIQNRIDDAFGTTQDTIQKRIDGAFGNTQDIIQNRINDAFGGTDSVSKSLDTLSKSATTTGNALTETLNPNQIFSKVLGGGGGGTSGDWLKYANQGAIRDLPISPKLEKSMSFLKDMGVQMEVFSGGQPGSGADRVGSHRHDFGGAADVFFNKDGRRLDWANQQDVPIFQDIVKQARDAGVTGFGAGPGYMQPGSMHLGFGTPGVWGAGGKGANAPGWLREAFGGGGGTGGLGGGGLGGFGGGGGGGTLAEAGIFGGGDIFGGTSGLQSGEALSSLTEASNSLKESFSTLSENTGTLTSSLTEGLTKATESATNLATDGIDKAASSLTNLSDQALTNTAQAVTQTATQTAQMGVTTGVTSAQVTTLGTASSTAAAQIAAAGAASSAQGVTSGISNLTKGAGDIAHLLPGFQTGGYTGGGLHTNVAGMVHKGEYVMDAQTTRNIGVATLEQMRHSAGQRPGAKTPRQEKEAFGTATGQDAKKSADSFKIINVLDPGVVSDYLATREGEQIIMNIMRRNNAGKK